MAVQEQKRHPRFKSKEELRFSRSFSFDWPTEAKLDKIAGADRSGTIRRIIAEEYERQLRRGNIATDQDKEA